MLKPIVFAVISMFFYASMNILMEQKFSKFNSLTIMICYSPIILAFGLIGRQIVKTSDPSFALPGKELIPWVLVMGICFALADYFYVSAYTAGGTVLVVTSIVVMFPVVAGLMKYGLYRTIPNTWTMVGCALAILAVICVAKGTTTAPPAP